MMLVIGRFIDYLTGSSSRFEAGNEYKDIYRDAKVQRRKAELNKSALVEGPSCKLSDKNKTERSRLSYVDSIKGFGIWLVVLGHMLDPGNFLKSYIYGFHMPLFFSAYGMTYTPPGNFKELFQRIVKRFFSYGVTYFIWALFYCNLNIRNLALVIWGTNDSLIGAESSGVLWFLPCYFISVSVFEIVMFLFLKKKNGAWIALAVFAAFTIAGYFLGTVEITNYHWPWGTDIALVASLFLWFGYFINNFLLKKILKRRMYIFAVILFCAVICALSGLIKTKSGYIRMASADYGNFPAFIVIALSGIMFSFLLIYCVDKVKTISKILSSIGKYSLVIMVLQRDVTNFYQSHIPQQYDITVIAVICSVVIIAVLYAVSYIISNILPFMAGKYSATSICIFNKKIYIIK